MWALHIDYGVMAHGTLGLADLQHKICKMLCLREIYMNLRPGDDASAMPFMASETNHSKSVSLQLINTVGTTVSGRSAREDGEGTTDHHPLTRPPACTRVPYRFHHNHGTFAGTMLHPLGSPKMPPCHDW